MEQMTLIEALEHLAQPRYLLIGGAALALAFVLTLLLRRQPKNVTAYVTENGKVMVNRSAIVELVQTSCEQLKEVSKPQVRINVRSGKAHFDVRLKLASGGRLRAVEETLQTHLRKELTDNLGIEALGRINIVAIGFKSGRVDQSSSTKKKDTLKTPAEDARELPVESADDLPSEPDAGETKP